jgi:beta-lactamase superfamily II metal-dependent hydrolase
MANDMLTIHFLNVGHGDSTIIEFPSGRVAMIDINNSKVLDDETASELAEAHNYKISYDFFKSLGAKDKQAREYEEKYLTDPVDYYISRYGKGREIFRFIATHPDMDHLTGLYRLNQEIQILNFWDTLHSVEKSDDPSDWEDTGYDIRDWRAYLKLRESESTPKALFYKAGDVNKYYDEDGVSIWAPFDHDQSVSEDDKINLLSYILYIVYGNCAVLLGGDSLSETWEAIYDAAKGELPKIGLLKAPHHGRKSGYYGPAIKATAPDYTVVSVGKLRKKDDAFASYEKYSGKGCFSTRFEGNITAFCFSSGSVFLYDQSYKQIT